MKDDAKLGIFLCACGEKIGGRLNLAELREQLGCDPDVSHCSIHSYLCEGPDLAAFTQEVQARGLNRVLLGACSDRIMKKKFAAALEPLGIMASQIDLVNLKDHVAAVHEDGTPALTRKAAALLAGGVRSLVMLEPYAPRLADFQGPTLILGGGISGYAAALELAQNGIESLIFSSARNPGDVLAGLKRTYPGSRIYFKDLEAMLAEVFASPMVSMAPDRPVEFVVGQMGDYRVGLQQDPHGVSEMTGSAIILALDREYAAGESSALGGGARVIDQLDLEERLAGKRMKPGRVVFLVDRPEDGRLAQELSAAAAWRNSQALVQEFPGVRPTVLYPADVKLPVTEADLVAAKRRGIELYSYRPDLHPVVESGYLHYVNPDDHLEHEVGWDTLVVSAIPGQPGAKTQELMRVLPIFSPNGDSLKQGPLALKPDQKRVESIILTGSAMKLCDLGEALQQGKNAARNILHLRDNARQSDPASPLVAVTVDRNLCSNCGLCNEVCSCGGVENVLPGKEASPQDVPYTCDGGGNCTAACPYRAMKLLNQSSQQLEARIRGILPQMQDNGILSFVCSRGGQSTAELAAIQGLSYSSRVYLVPVNCLSSIDPIIFSMAFLNGANGILLICCRPTSCHYGIGVDHAWHRVDLMKKLLAMCGLERQRISLGYVDVNQPEAFVRLTEAFLDNLDDMGPLDRSEDHQKKLLAAHAIMHRPRVRWFLGVSLRRPSEKEFPGDQHNAVDFDESMQDLLREEYLAARIIGALSDGPLNPPAIAEALEEQAATVAPVLNELLRDNRLIRQRWEDGYPLYALAKSV